MELYIPYAATVTTAAGADHAAAAEKGIQLMRN